MAKRIWESRANKDDVSRCWRCGHDKYPQLLDRITDGTGRRVLCANCSAFLVAAEELSFVNDPNLTDDITGKSGAVEYVSGDERYVLERQTMERLILHNLTKEEWLALSRKYGEDKFMLHEDFYAEDGTALQPTC